MHYDSITHSSRALAFLIDSVGVDRVLLGSDYPFDMGNLDCVTRVAALQLLVEQTAAVLGARARQLLGLAQAADLV